MPSREDLQGRTGISGEQASGPTRRPEEERPQAELDLDQTPVIDLDEPEPIPELPPLRPGA